MSGVTQATFMNQRSFGPPPPSAIGAAYEGGFYAGQIGVSSTATHYLVVAPLSSGQSTLAWKNADTSTPGADSKIDGPQNTADMVADGNSTVYPAAHFCNNLVIGGFSDWYMPALNELDVCYFNLKPNTTTNYSSGINANSVPERTSNYPSGGPPTQTSVVDFQVGGAEAFSPNSYWNSYERNTTEGSTVYFSSGFRYATTGKTPSYRVRAIRRVAV